MIIIGEKINGMYKAVAQAIKEKNKSVIQDLALKQVEAGATFLDVNAGPATDDPVSTIQWLVTTIQEVTDTPLAIDSPKPNVLEAGLSLCKGKPLINSTTGDQTKLDTIVPLAVKYNARLLGLAMDEKGIPNTSSERAEIALRILAQAMEAGIPVENIYLDPVVLPVKFAQAQVPVMLEAVREFRMLADPPPHIALGLSNVSQGTLDRPLVNRTYLAMALACGADTAILDPLDKNLMDALITAELLLNKNIYCDDYLKAYKS